MAKEIKIVPDLTLKGTHYDSLDIIVSEDFVEFRANVDNSGNTFRVARQKLKVIL